MRKVKNITVCVSPEIYRQTRHLAAEYDSSVSAIVASLLERLPAILERLRFPKGGPKPPAPVAPASCAASAPSPISACLTDEGLYTPVNSSQVQADPKIANSASETVTPPLINDVSATCSELPERAHFLQKSAMRHPNHTWGTA